MKEQNKKQSDAEKLRQRAEKQLKKQQSDVGSLSSEIDIRKINYELQVHQIELEMQNKELLLAKIESDAAAKKYTELYDFAPSGYFTLTKEGEITELNIHGTSILGKKRQKLINVRFGFFITDDTKPIFNLLLDKVFEGKGKESCEVTLSVESKNSPTYVYITGQVAENDEQCQVSVVDITERKQAEQKLIQSDRVFNLTLDMFCIAGFDGYFKYLNPAWERTLGWTIEELLSKPWLDFVHPDDVENTKNIKSVVVDGKEIYQFENRYISKDGSIKWLSWNSQPFPKENIMIGAVRDVTEAKRIENELLQAKNKAEESKMEISNLLSDLQLSQEIADIGNWQLDPKIGIPIWSEKIFEIYERNPVDGLPHVDDYKNIYETEQYEIFNKAITNAIKKGDNYDIVLKLKLPSGRIKWVRALCQPDLSNQNEAGYFLRGTIQDITKYKETEQELIIAKEKAEESKTNLNSLINNRQDSIWSIDKSYNYINFNTFFKEQYFATFNIELTKGLNSLNILTPELREFWKTKYDKALSGENIIFEFSNQVENELHFYEVSLNPIISKEVITGVSALSINITDHKKLDKNLQDSESYLKETQAIANLGTYTLDIPSGKWVSGEVLDKIFGIDADYEKSLEGWESIIHPEWQKIMTEYFAQEVIVNKNKFDKEYKIIRKNDGAERWVHGIGNLKYNESDQPITMIGTIQDITERKDAEEELIKAKEAAENANKLKTEFLNNMSHEIRTPLNGIMGFSEMLYNPSISDEKRKNYSKIVKSSSQQLLRIIDDILEISTLETKQTKLDETEFCLNDFLMELFTIFNLKSEEKKVPVYLEKPLHDKEIHIISDKTKLNKILSNLIENAIKFTAQGSVEIGYSVEHKFLKLYVKDTGIGISAENHQKIFERFSQEGQDISLQHGGGLGLGLSICNENAQLLGGNITLESEKGKGSTFYVSIPYKPVGKETPDNNKSTTKTPAKDKPKTILVAEDEEMNYMYIEALFEDEIELDCNLIHAKNGKEALDICLENQNIDLVLMDIKMPVMNGNEATLEIKMAFPDLPVIAQTAYSTESEKREAMKHGYDDFMSKPLDRDKLFETINKYVNIK